MLQVWSSQSVDQPGTGNLVLMALYTFPELFYKNLRTFAGKCIRDIALSYLQET